MPEHDGHTKRPPVKTNFGGFMPSGDGVTINNHIQGVPDFIDNTGITPGGLLGGLSPTPTGAPKGEDIDVDDLFEEGAKAFYEIGGLVNEISDYVPELGKSNNKLINLNVLKQNQNVQRKHIQIRNVYVNGREQEITTITFVNGTQKVLFKDIETGKIFEE